MQPVTEAERRAPVGEILGRRCLLYAALLWGAAAACLSSRATADNFAGLTYDAATDELVVSVRYLGTNSEHGFSLKWGDCKEGGDGVPREVDAELLDDQWRDRAVTEYHKTVRLSLSSMPCRPARLTLLLAPRFYATVGIP